MELPPTSETLRWGEIHWKHQTSVYLLANSDTCIKILQVPITFFLSLSFSAPLVCSAQKSEAVLLDYLIRLCWITVSVDAPLYVWLCVFFLASNPMMPQNGGTQVCLPDEHTHFLVTMWRQRNQALLPNMNPISCVHLTLPRPGLGPKWKLHITVTLSQRPSVACLSVCQVCLSSSVCVCPRFCLYLCQYLSRSLVTNLPACLHVCLSLVCLSVCKCLMPDTHSLRLAVLCISTYLSLPVCVSVPRSSHKEEHLQWI